MLRLGSDVVATTTGRVQQHAATVILETARCASGTVSAGTTATDGADGVPVRTTADNDREPGCATAALEEVNVLLDGLQSESVALREVSIQVSNTGVVMIKLLLVLRVMVVVVVVVVVMLLLGF